MTLVDIVVPDDFKKQLQQEGTSVEEVAHFLQAVDAAANTSIRLNPLKGLDAIRANLPLGDMVAWADDAFYLSERPAFTLDPFFHGGGYYVQEASSMFIECALKQYMENPVCVLDLCAAPGGKTTHLLSILPQDTLLVSNEVIHSRAHILSENVQKWGHPNTVVTQNDPKDFEKLGAFFDIIVIDAPCSGEGMFRKLPHSREEWSLEHVEHCAARQQRIVQDAWKALKPGGLLLYSTCTYNQKENEGVLAELNNTADFMTLPVDLPENQGIAETFREGIYSYRFWPHRAKGEGFCLSVVRKGGNPVHSTKKSKKTKKGKGPKSKSGFVKVDASTEQHLRKLLKEDKKLIFKQIEQAKKQTINAYFKAQWPLIEQLYNDLRVIYAGIAVGEVARKGLIPNPALALSALLDHSNAAFPIVEVDKETALQYLAQQNIVLDAPKGWFIVAYNGLCLGWAKGVQQRINNYYPKHWRIRMDLSKKL